LGTSRSRHAHRRQSVDQEFRRRSHLPARSQVQHIRGSRRAAGSTHRQAHRHLRHPFGRGEQSLSARFLGRQRGADRRQDQAADGLPHADAEFASAARPRRRSRPHVVAEYFGNAVGMLDSETGKIQEWQVPTPWSSPYDAVVDHNGDAWTASMNTTASPVSMSRAANTPSISCRARPISAASLSMIQRSPARCGSAAYTALRSSRLSRWIEDEGCAVSPHRPPRAA